MVLSGALLQVNAPRPSLVGLVEDEQSGLVVAVQELHVNDIQQLLIELPDIDDVAGEEIGLLPAETEKQRGQVRGEPLYCSSTHVLN